VKARAEMGIGARRQINLRRRNVREGVECAFLVRLRTAATRARVRRYRVIELFGAFGVRKCKLRAGVRRQQAQAWQTLLSDCSVVA
jgi:hypothetical protein